jgi:CBS domain-containing protein
MLVSQILKSKPGDGVITIGPDATVAEAVKVLSEPTDAVLQKMTDGRFRHMPVMEGDEMVGLISIGDVVKTRLEELSAEKDALEGMIKGF